MVSKPFVPKMAQSKASTVLFVQRKKGGSTAEQQALIHPHSSIPMGTSLRYARFHHELVLRGGPFLVSEIPMPGRADSKPSEDGTDQTVSQTFVLKLAQPKARIWPWLSDLLKGRKLARQRNSGR